MPTPGNEFIGRLRLEDLNCTVYIPKLLQASQQLLQDIRGFCELFKTHWLCGFDYCLLCIMYVYTTFTCTCTAWLPKVVTWCNKCAMEITASASFAVTKTESLCKWNDSFLAHTELLAELSKQSTGLLAGI